MARSRTRTKPQTKELSVAIDLGGSLTKAVATDIDGDYCFLAIAPEILEVQDQMLQMYSSRSASLGSEIDWISHNGAKYVWGKTVRNVFGGLNNLKTLKSDTSLGIPKILALIFLLKQKYQAKNLSLRLAILLPCTEFISGSKDSFMVALRQSLGLISSSQGDIKIDLEDLNIFPEGAGAYISYSKVLGQELRQLDIGVSTLGYRNINYFLVQNAVPNKFYGNYLGFSSIVRSVSEYLGITNGGHLATLVFMAGVEPDVQSCESLLAQCPNAAQVTAASFHAHLCSLIDEYKRKIQLWFEQTVDSYPHHIIFTGGTLEYLQPVISKLVSTSAKLVANPGYIPSSTLFQESLISDIHGLYAPEKRFIDIFSIFLFQLDKDESYRPLTTKFISQ